MSKIESTIREHLKDAVHIFIKPDIITKAIYVQMDKMKVSYNEVDCLDITSKLRDYQLEYFSRPDIVELFVESDEAYWISVMDLFIEHLTSSTKEFLKDYHNWDPLHLIELFS